MALDGGCMKRAGMGAVPAFAAARIQLLKVLCLLETFFAITELRIVKRLFRTETRRRDLETLIILTVFHCLSIVPQY
jgi:hypothetical protein